MKKGLISLLSTLVLATGCARESYDVYFVYNCSNIMIYYGGTYTESYHLEKDDYNYLSNESMLINHPNFKLTITIYNYNDYFKVDSVSKDTKGKTYAYSKLYYAEYEVTII